MERNTEVREQSDHFLLSPISPVEISMANFNLLVVQQVSKLAKSQLVTESFKINDYRLIFNIIMF